MAEEEQEQKNIQLKVPLGVLAAALAVGAAAAAYFLSNGDSEDGEPAKGKSRSRLGPKRLDLIIKIIENDASRKVLLAALKLMARRS